MLIQLVLYSLPVYYLSLFSMPVTVAKIIEKRMKFFLRSGEDEENNPNLMKWIWVSKLKQDGGLG